MKAGMQLLLTENLKTLRLSAIATHLEEQLRQAREKRCDFDEFLLGLTELELQVRGETRLKKRLREANFPLIKTLGGFDFAAATGLDGRLIAELAGGEYIRQKRNVILAGKTGTGKTHLATGMGIEACKQGVRTCFISACALVNKLVEARDQRDLSRLMKQMARYGLLIVDELGYVPFSKEGAELLFQTLAQRHERGSVIITTNLGFGDWTQVFADPNLTAALLDRLTHKAHIINCTWESYRFKETMKMQKLTKSNNNGN